RPFRELLAQDGRRAVAAAVVDEDHLVAEPQRIERRIEAREERLEARLFVIDRNDDRELHASTFFAAWQTRSTSLSNIAGKSGNVTMLRPTRSACGNWPARQPRLR